MGASGIVGMNEEDGTGVRGNGTFEGAKINEPALGVFEGVRNKVDVLQAGEEFEQRIAGFGEQEFLAGIAEQAEHVGVGFAGAGGKQERFRIDSDVMVVEVVPNDFAAGGERAFRLGIVDERCEILEGREDASGIVMEAALCWV